MRTTLALLLVLPFFASCRSTNSTLAVVGGKLVRANEHLAAHTLALVETEGDVEEYCTAVLIAPNAALTAAHCFLEAKTKPALFFGTSIPSSREKEDSRFVDFNDVIIHPNFSQKKLKDYDQKIRLLTQESKIPVPKEGLDDLAIVLFTPPKLTAYRPVPISEGIPSGEKSTAAGFGCLSTECEEYSNRLRKVELTFLRELGASRMLLMSAGENQGTCTGDSGGPDFLQRNGRWELLSIVSTGPESCEAGLSIETRAAPYRSWIESVVSSK